MNYMKVVKTKASKEYQCSVCRKWHRTEDDAQRCFKKHADDEVKKNCMHKYPRVSLYLTPEVEDLIIENECHECDTVLEKFELDVERGGKELFNFIKGRVRTRYVTRG